MHRQAAGDPRYQPAAGPARQDGEGVLELQRVVACQLSLAYLVRVVWSCLSHGSAKICYFVFVFQLSSLYKVRTVLR